MESRLCPKCGAYWRCDCKLDEMTLPLVACDHDWVEAVGVETDPALGLDEKRVVLCRLCGLYSVQPAA